MNGILSFYFSLYYDSVRYGKEIDANELDAVINWLNRQADKPYIEKNVEATDVVSTAPMSRTGAVQQSVNTDYGANDRIVSAAKNRRKTEIITKKYKFGN